jgi:hypothetical protein
MPHGQGPLGCRARRARREVLPPPPCGRKRVLPEGPPPAPPAPPAPRLGAAKGRGPVGLPWQGSGPAMSAGPAGRAGWHPGTRQPAGAHAGGRAGPGLPSAVRLGPARRRGVAYHWAPPVARPRGAAGEGVPPQLPVCGGQGATGELPFPLSYKKSPPPHSLAFLPILFSSSSHHMHFHLSARSARCEVP